MTAVLIAWRTLRTLARMCCFCFASRDARTGGTLSPDRLN